MAYWDSSALLKVYISEPDSAYFDRVSTTEGPVVCSAIATTEVLCALHRKDRAGELQAGSAGTVFQKFLSDAESGRIQMIPYGSEVVVEATRLVKLVFAQPRPVMLRALDAIHVSSALLARAKVVVATDRRLRAAALVAGLRVLP